MPKRRQPRNAPQLEQLVQAIAQLDRDDKQELLAILKAMLEAEENEQESNDHTLKPRHQYRGSKGGQGYYERKMISGCEPYLYLRYFLWNLTDSWKQLQLGSSLWTYATYFSTTIMQLMIIFIFS